MKAFVDGIISQVFNTEAQDKERLTADMVQAFYRRDHGTIDLLANQGAAYTAEMLEVAVMQKDEHLIKRCFTGGVIPTDQMICRAIDNQDIPLTSLLVNNAILSDRVQHYIKLHATDDMKEALTKKSAPHHIFG